MGDETPDMFRSSKRKALGLERGRELRDDGIKRATDHADRVNAAWLNRAYAIAVELVAKKAEPFFTYELVRGLKRHGIETPPDGRAWAGVTTRLARAGLIRSLGIFPCTDPDQHMAPKTKWERV